MYNTGRDFASLVLIKDREWDTMKQLSKKLIIIFLPWLVFFIKDRPIHGLMALIIQATGFGWIVASVWAWRVTFKNIEPEEVVSNQSVKQ